jgi:hypothetical protein
MAWLITIGMALCKGFYFFNIQGQNVTKLAQKTTDHIEQRIILAICLCCQTVKSRERWIGRTACRSSVLANRIVDRLTVLQIATA